MSELVVVNELLTSASQVAARLFAFPGCAGEEEVQRLPRVVKVDV